MPLHIYVSRNVFGARKAAGVVPWRLWFFYYAIGVREMLSLGRGVAALHAYNARSIDP